jgi:hypothetical protein
MDTPKLTTMTHCRPTAQITTFENGRFQIHDLMQMTKNGDELSG